MTSQESLIAIVDDHFLLASSLKNLITTFGGFSVVHISKDGTELQKNLSTSSELPEIVLLDINMPVMNGFETCAWLQKNHPKIKVLALSMEDDERSIIKMIHNGARGYLLKDSSPEKLKNALVGVRDTGYYHSQLVSDSLDNTNNSANLYQEVTLKPRELQFVELACTDKTYVEIADVMNLSPKTIDGYRQNIFDTYNIKNRVGLVLFAIENNLVNI